MTDHAHDEACSAQHGYTEEKKLYTARIRRIEGQARGIGKMIEEDRYCIDILTQISAMTKALESLGLALLDDHLHHCVRDAAAQGGAIADEKLDEASKAIARFIR